MSEPLKKPNQAPESYTPKEVPEIVRLAEQVRPPAIDGMPTPYSEEFRIFHLPASRAIGIEESIKLHGAGRLPAQPLWVGLTDSEIWQTLRSLPQLIPGTSLGWTCDYVAETDSFSYIACVLCPVGTPVPEGCQFRDIPPTEVAAGLWGDTMSKVVKRMKKQGYVTNWDAEGCGWNTELYFDEYHSNPPPSPKPNKEGCRWLVPCKKEEPK